MMSHWKGLVEIWYVRRWSNHHIGFPFGKRSQRDRQNPSGTKIANS